MIIQILLDFLAEMFSAFIALIPAAPVQMTSALNAIGTGADQLAVILSKLGPIMPWDSFTTVLQWWVGSLIFFAAMLILRVVLWAVGR